MKTDIEIREKAMDWWNGLPIIEKSLLAQKYSDYLHGRGFVSITGREVEHIYKQEKKLL